MLCDGTYVQDSSLMRHLTNSAAAAAALRKRMRLKASLSFDVEEIEGGSEDLGKSVVSCRVVLWRIPVMTQDSD